MKRIGEACAVATTAAVLTLGISADTKEPMPRAAIDTLAHAREISAGRYSGGCVLKKVVTKGWTENNLRRREVALTVDLTASKEALDLDKSKSVNLVGMVEGEAGMIHEGHVYGIQLQIPPVNIITPKGTETFSVFPHDHHTAGEKAAVYVETVASSNQGEGTPMRYTNARAYCGTMVLRQNDVWAFDSATPPFPTQFWKQ